MWSWRPTNALHSVANIYIESTGFICDVTQYEFAVRVVGHRIRFCSSSLWTNSVISTRRMAAQSSKRGIVVAWAAVTWLFRAQILLELRRCCWQFLGMILRCLPFRRHRRMYDFHASGTFSRLCTLRPGKLDIFQSSKRMTLSIVSIQPPPPFCS